MKLAQFACAFGRHRLDPGKVRRIHGSQVSRCLHCNLPMEEVTPHVWEVQRVRDAGLGRRHFP
ncbi:MAG: hypothetical protein JNJ92_11740 [Altererythrobacter sp.]|nr:hypothetical protein [Altererythrobacter sp.]